MQNTNYLLQKQITDSLSTLKASEKNVLDYVLKGFIYSSYPLDEYKPFSKNFFRAKLSGRYLKPLRSLIEKGIIQVYINPTTDKEFYHFPSKEEKAKDENCKGQCKEYRINPAIISGLKKRAWQSKQVNKRPYMETPSEQEKAKQTKSLQWTAKLLQYLTIEADDIEGEINKIVTSEFIEDRFSELVEGNKDCFYYCIDGRMSHEPRPSYKIATIAAMNGKKALFCKKTRIVYIDDATELKANKQEVLKVVYLELMSNIKERNFFLDRSETNNRLTTTFAVFPNALMHLLRFRGQRIAQLDIKNSQFCILSNLIYGFSQKDAISPILQRLKALEKGKYFAAFKASYHHLQTTNGELRADAKDFLRCCKNGELYEVIAKNCAISRSEAKQAMFIVCFASFKHNPAIKAVVKCLFPSIIAFIDATKEQLGKGLEFAVMLQLIESFICIDNVLLELKKANIPALTKHDSFCVPEPIEPQASEVVKKCLSNFLPFGFTLKIEG